MDDKKLSAVKIGARVLDEKQAESLLPGYNKIADQINVFRQEAQKVRAKGDYSADNTISILGGRGSGKTSVMLTFKHYHSEDETYKESDIILPIIIPEDMSDSNDTLGWFLGLLGEEVKKIEQKLKERSRQSRVYDNHLDKCLKKEHSGLKEQYDTLVRNYVMRKERYFELIQGKSVGKAEYIKQNEEYVHADQQLGVDFRKFIDMIIDYKKMTSPNNKIEPLILVFFDDVDISAERCPEALETIRKYFAHPNIVVFVSGDNSVFLEAMTLEFLRREKIDSKMYPIVFKQLDRTALLEGSLGEDSNALNQRKTRSQDYLKKVLPPSFRFQMKKIRDKDKGDFFYPLNNDDKDNVELKGLLSGIVFSNKKTYMLPHPVYYRIFDDNPRGLINPFYFLYQKRESQNPLWDNKDISQFLNVLVNSSLRLSDNRDVVDKTIQIGIREKETTRIDYQYISDLYANFERHIRANENDKAVNISEEAFYEDMITLYLLTDYFENLCRTAAAKWEDVEILNKKEVLFRILNKPNPSKNKTIYPNTQDAVLINVYERLSEEISFRNLQRLFDRNSSLYFEAKFYKALAKIHGGQGNEIEQIHGINTFFRRMYNDDEIWVQNHIDYLFEKGKSLLEVLEDNIESYTKELDFLGQDGLDINGLQSSLFLQDGQSLDDNIQLHLEKSILQNPTLTGNDPTEQKKIADQLTNSIEKEMELLEREIDRYGLYQTIETDYKTYRIALWNQHQNKNTEENIDRIQNLKYDVTRALEDITGKKNEMEQENDLDFELIKVQKVSKETIAVFDPSELEIKYDFYVEMSQEIGLKKRYLKWQGPSLTDEQMVLVINYFNLIVEMGFLYEFSKAILKKEVEMKDTTIFYPPIRGLSNLRKKLLDKLDSLVHKSFRASEELAGNVSFMELDEYMVKNFGAFVRQENPIEYFKANYSELSKRSVSIRLELDYITKDKNVCYESMIQTLDSLIEQRRLLSSHLYGKIRLTEGQVNFLRHLLVDFRISQPMSRIINELLATDEFSKSEYQSIVDELYRLYRQEMDISPNSKRMRLESLIINVIEMRNAVQEAVNEPEVERNLYDEVYRDSLTSCIKAFVQLTLQLKAWVQNREIEENKESFYFRQVKDWFRTNTKSKGMFLDRFERYITNKLK